MSIFLGAVQKLRQQFWNYFELFFSILKSSQKKPGM